jgi:2-succinyl-6-hydroxy-2,4-cyclohexadiene-1-carboxylate synthase
VTIGVEWTAPSAGKPSTGRLVLVHGFTQTRASWTAIGASLAGDGYEVVSVDAPGHGESATVQVDLVAGADLLGRATGPATYIGYSMGGRMALHLAVSRPDLVERLVLVSSTAGIADDRERAARRATDEQRAASIERDGVAAFLADWLSLPLFANLPPDAARLDDRLGNTAAGLASSLRLAGTGAQQSLWPALESLPMPVLVVTGQLDAKFTAIAERMAALIPDAVVEIIAGAGHVVHLERPAEFLEVLRRWLDATPVGPAGGTSADPPAEQQSERRQRAERQL